jgi:predicted nucleic acid-binding protein
VTRYLVDTNVISATAPTTAVKRLKLVEWMDSHSADLFLSAVTNAEIADGIAKAKREGAAASSKAPKMRGRAVSNSRQSSCSGREGRRGGRRSGRHRCLQRQPMSGDAGYLS